MITILASAALSPFMVAVPAEASATTPEVPPIAYNREPQNTEAISEDELNAGANGTFSFIPGSHSQQTVDDWHLC